MDNGGVCRTSGWIMEEFAEQVAGYGGVCRTSGQIMEVFVEQVVG